MGEGRGLGFLGSKEVATRFQPGSNQLTMPLLPLLLTLLLPRICDPKPSQTHYKSTRLRRCHHCCCHCCCPGFATQNRRTNVTNPRVYVAVAMVVASELRPETLCKSVTIPHVYGAVASVVASDVRPEIRRNNVTHPRVYDAAAFVVASDLRPLNHMPDTACLTPDA